MNSSGKSFRNSYMSATEKKSRNFSEKYSGICFENYSRCSCGDSSRRSFWNFCRNSFVISSFENSPMRTSRSLFESNSWNSFRSFTMNFSEVSRRILPIVAPVVFQKFLRKYFQKFFREFYRNQKSLALRRFFQEFLRRVLSEVLPGIVLLEFPT